ncbi:TetR/AcrR family transcriptional regulator (plasmid) [Novosphingobium resinovorum]|uniref:TetR/AcrR family transcriptional regulator n=1 Tax=Novosphingobium TaxID=165696 RepID=UPI001B3C8A39|nr:MULTISPECIES: TetR/AcrR family transcriptional regulator [Novosphingobium]MBF7015255.1 TetR/AcrR family transcriptional regulator [Novosphingobium sp. HR1a]WJM29930.1 TetR/AcrR family transcriptional regulator [Novosphingobium resinovorum]
MSETGLPDFYELSPAGMIPESEGLQHRRSAETRLLILDAAIECLAEHGYSDTTTHLIAKQANISRGAMLHHYATKQDLITAVIDYAFFRLMKTFSEAIRSLTEQERTSLNVGITVDWECHNTRDFQAYLELNNAARTDPDLKSLFVEKAQRHDHFWRQELIANFPEWANSPEKLDKARRLTQAIMTGMIVNRDVWSDPAMEQTILEFLTRLLISIREDKIAF